MAGPGKSKRTEEELAQMRHSTRKEFIVIAVIIGALVLSAAAYIVTVH